MVGSRPHIPAQVKESFGCFSHSPRGRKVPTAITAEQPTLEGPLPRTTSSLPGCVRPLAPNSPAYPGPARCYITGEVFLPPALGSRRALPAGRSQSTVDFGQAGRWPGKGCCGSRSDTALGACLLRPSPTFPGGSRAPGAGHGGRSPAGEHPQRRRGRGQAGSCSSSARRTQLVGLAAGSPPGLPHLPPSVPGMMAT